jgi:hypothetical protein
MSNVIFTSSLLGLTLPERARKENKKELLNKNDWIPSLWLSKRGGASFEQDHTERKQLWEHHRCYKG